MKSIERQKTRNSTYIKIWRQLYWPNWGKTEVYWQKHFHLTEVYPLYLHVYSPSQNVLWHASTRNPSDSLIVDFCKNLGIFFGGGGGCLGLLSRTRTLSSCVLLLTRQNESELKVFLVCRRQVLRLLENRGQAQEHEHHGATADLGRQQRYC